MVTRPGAALFMGALARSLDKSLIALVREVTLEDKLLCSLTGERASVGVRAAASNVSAHGDRPELSHLVPSR